tara:strand:+ start:1390 stop:1782 length:393 start_codon:yes stop_codon:yes gene_type:complete
MQDTRAQEKTDMSAALALELQAWQKAGGVIKLLPSCQYAKQLYCVQTATQQSEGGSMRTGTFVPVPRVKVQAMKAWVMDDYQRAEVNAKQRAVYKEWIDKGLTQAEAAKISNKEKMRLCYALRHKKDDKE